MEYLTTDLIVFYITLTAISCYGVLFVYHFVKKDSNKSLMILAGCLCLAMVVIHTFTSYKNGLGSDVLQQRHSFVFNLDDSKCDNPVCHHWSAPFAAAAVS
ncbi:MAG: hypothetical protein MJK04_24030 [Psychrosphaera sp.]|nr:hypothetical protein [Psychrosphaera sp.]